MREIPNSIYSKSSSDINKYVPPMHPTSELRQRRKSLINTLNLDSTKNIESSSSSSDSDTDEDEEIKKLENAPFEFPGAYHLIGPFWINRSVKDRIQSSFESVVFPSLFTKAFGRLAIIMGFVVPSTQNIGLFILSNLMYAAGPVMLISGLVRFTYVLGQDLYAKKEWSNALLHASIEAIKTSIKFFIVYMMWVLAIALFTKLSLLSGGMLPLGIIGVALVVTLTFVVASFLVDKLPSILMSLRHNPWETFKTKFQELHLGVFPALLEGSSWTLMDNSLVSISDHITGFGGKMLDLIGVSLIVSGLFFLGAVVYCTASRYVAMRRFSRQKMVTDPTQREALEEAINDAVNNPNCTPKQVMQSFYNIFGGEHKIKASVCESSLLYIKAQKEAKAAASNDINEEKGLVNLTSAHTEWLRLSKARIQTVTSGGSISIANSQRESAHFQTLVRSPSSRALASEIKRNRHIRNRNRLLDDATMTQKSTMEELQKCGLFSKGVIKAKKQNMPVSSVYDPDICVQF